MQAEMLTQSKIMEYWPMIEQELDRIPHVWAAWWTKEWMQFEAMNGRIQIWGVGDERSIKTVFFTRVIEYPAARHLNFMLALGNGLEETLPVFVATMQRFAPMRGCEIASVMGRRGWERKLREYGFKLETVTLTAPVKKETLQ